MNQLRLKCSAHLLLLILVLSSTARAGECLDGNYKSKTEKMGRIELDMTTATDWAKGYGMLMGGLASFMASFVPRMIGQTELSTRMAHVYPNPESDEVDCRVDQDWFTIDMRKNTITQAKAKMKANPQKYGFNGNLAHDMSLRLKYEFLMQKWVTDPNMRYADALIKKMGLAATEVGSKPSAQPGK